MQDYQSIRSEFLEIRMKIRRKMCHEFKKQGVEFSPNEHKAMHKIMAAKSLSQQMLAEAMKRDKAQIARMVARLLRQELLHKVEDPDDKRRVQLSLSPKGEKVVIRMDEHEVEIIKNMLCDFTDEEAQHFSALLIRANQNMSWS